MKKRLLMLSMTSVITLGALVSCDTITAKQDDEGRDVIVSIGDKNYTADELFAEYGKTTSGAAAYYDAIYDVLVRHAEPVTEAIESVVNGYIDSVTQLATDNANKNGTTYRTELSNILIERGVEDLDELRELYILEEQKTKFEDKWYDANEGRELVKKDETESAKITRFEDLTLEYVQEKNPYHVRHILVKVSANSSFYDGQISSDNAKKISHVAQMLSSDLVTFGNVALTESDDNGNDANSTSSSASKFGNLGIMDRDSGYVNEFTFGIFQYDAFFNQANKDNDRISMLDIPGDKDIVISGSDEDVEYLKVSDVLSKENINFIPFGKVMQLEEYADVEGYFGDFYGDSNSGKYKQIENGNASYFPRNILFNNYFNNHGLNFILKPTADEIADFDLENKVSDSRFVSLGEDLGNVEVLCDENQNPILVTRAGSGSGDSGYQGLHFIVIEKSPVTASDADLLYYYSTDVPGSSDIVTGDKRYVTFIDSDRSTYQENADEIEDKVKGFDSNIKYRIFKEEVAKEGVEIKKEILDLITEYMENSIERSKFNAEESYKESWASYLKMLMLQKSIQEKKVIGEDDEYIVNIYKDLSKYGK